MKKIFFIAIIASFLTTSCVTTKKYDQQKALVSKYIDEKEECKETLKSTEDLLTETKEQLNSSNNENTTLKESVFTLTKATKNLSKLANEEKELRQKTNEDYEAHMLNSSKKEENLTQDLAEKERQLTNKEAALASIQNNLEKREVEVKIIKTELVKKETDLNDKSLRIEELESKIMAQNTAMSNLKNNVTKALKEFTSEDLTVSEKAGKIYVSLSENLLFKSGSFNLDNKGASAIEKLAEVLAKQKNVDIIVEGHTDSDPFKGSGALLDNWDLSVKRATSVVRILEKNNVPKEKIVASGRADNNALTSNSTKEEKAKNRRTEIILSPDLEHLMNLLQAK